MLYIATESRAVRFYYLPYRLHDTGWRLLFMLAERADTWLALDALCWEVWKRTGERERRDLLQVRERLVSDLQRACPYLNWREIIEEDPEKGLRVCLARKLWLGWCVQLTKLQNGDLRIGPKPIIKANPFLVARRQAAEDRISRFVGAQGATEPGESPGDREALSFSFGVRTRVRVNGGPVKRLTEPAHALLIALLDREGGWATFRELNKEVFDWNSSEELTGLYQVRVDLFEALREIAPEQLWHIRLARDLKRGYRLLGGPLNELDLEKDAVEDYEQDAPLYQDMQVDLL